ETMLYARSRVVHAAARYDHDLLDVPWLDLDDQDGLVVEAQASNELGFTGKASIHPKQVPIINKVFSPSAEDVERARRFVAEFANNTTGLLVVDGELIERPVLRTMHRILAVADQLGV
ncbi:MAG: HpcH/HpaI aldolase/citrate lyase family protein, partial [Pseudomonadota bacterium]|nr:HpcH/HpaI aldolase/citrate lyase family protein [Pseudomonadota bacterium]